MQRPDSSTDPSSSLESLEAYLDSFDVGIDAALSKLAGKDDPDSIRRKLAILSRANRIPEAASIIKGRELNQSWADLAVGILTANGDLDDAEAILSWAENETDRTFKVRCMLAFADGVLTLTFKEHGNGKFLLPAMLTPAEEYRFTKVRKCLEPLYAALLLSKKVETEIESLALQRLLTSLYLIGDRPLAAKIVYLLETRVPIPLRVAEAVLQGLISCKSEFPTRLRAEHPKEFKATFFACLLEVRYLDQKALAFESAMKLVEVAKTIEDKESLSELLYELTLELHEVEPTLFDQTLSRLLDSSSRTFQMIKADQALKSGAVESALEILEAIRDENDPGWLRTYGNVKLKHDEPLAALDLYKKASQLFPDPELFDLIRKIAAKNNLTEDAEKALLYLLSLRPDDTEARLHLVEILTRASRYAQAVAHLRWLIKADPKNQPYAVNLAVCLSLSGGKHEKEQALEILDGACAQEPPFLHAFLTRAKLLQAKGANKLAFSSLHIVREKFWGDPDFLMTYMSIGHVSNHEADAHQALEQLERLRAEGVVGAEKMRAVSLDDMVEMLNVERQRGEVIRRTELEGKFPWTMTAELSNDVPYWSWALRTQPLDWISDDPLHRVSYTIYSTNSYRVLHSETGTVSLEEVTCPPAKVEVVADISSLITLHSMDILKEAVGYFGTIFFPISYLSKSVDDTRRLFPHQLSKKTSAERVKDAVDRQAISVVNDEYSDLAEIDEYKDALNDTERLYRILDVISTLHSSGKLSDANRNAALRVAHKPAIATSNGRPLSPSQSVVVELSTLDTLITVGLFDLFVKEFTVHISRSTYSEVQSKIRAFTALEDIRQRHDDLWDQITTDNRFVPTPMTMDAALAIENKSEVRAVALSAYQLAEQKRIPLLVDDRVCQAIVLNSRNTDEFAAFGTDRLLLALHEAGVIDDDRLADSCLSLMRWRYRFIVPRSPVLKILASRFASHPPGDELRLVARYVHDCMRDHGLFVGSEPTNPPISIAVRMFQTWAQLTAELIMDIWLDLKFSEESAQSFTQWAILEMLPSAPRGLNQKMQFALGDLLKRTVITQAIVRASGAKNLDRVSSGLREISQWLEVDDEQYLNIVGGIANANRQ